MRTRGPSRRIAIAAIVACAGGVHAQMFTFLGGDGRWHNDQNWQPEGVPGTGPFVGATVTVEEDKGPVVIDLATVLDLSRVTIDGLEMHGGVIEVDQASTIKGLSMDRGILRPGEGTTVTIDALGDQPNLIHTGGTFAGPGSFLNVGDMDMLSGRVETGFENLGVLTLRSEGTTGRNGDLVLAPGGELVNRWVVQLRDGADVFSGGLLHNEGTVRTSGDVAIERLEQASGTFSVDSGVCHLSTAEWSGGEIRLASGAEVSDRMSPQDWRFSGPVHVSGEGSLDVQSASEVSGPLTLDVSGGAALWLSTIQLSSEIINHGALSTSSIFVGDGSLRNASGGTLTAIGFRMADQTTLTNSGRVTVGTTGFVLDESAVVENRADGVIEMREAGSIRSFPSDSHVSNSGVIERSEAGPIAAWMTAMLINQAGGVVRVLNGELDLLGEGVWQGGSRFEVQAPGMLTVVSPHNGGIEVLGSVELSGTGTCRLGGAHLNLLIPSDSQLVLNMPGGGVVLSGPSSFNSVRGAGELINRGNLSWSGTSIGTPGTGLKMVNEGAMFVGSSGFLFADLSNRGAVSQTGTFNLGGTVRNESAWKFDEASEIRESFIPRFVNAGTVTHDNIGGSIIRTPFSNEGTVHAARGVLTFTNVEQIVDGRLTGGIWSADAGARIDLPRPLGSIIGGTSVTGGTDSMRWLADLRRMDDQTRLRVVERLGTFQPLVNAGRATIEMLPGGVVEVTLLDNGDGASGEPAPDAEIQQIGGGNCPDCEPPLIIATRLDNHARLVPGGHDAAGPFNLQGELVMHPTGRILVEVGGPQPPQHDAFTITGPAQLAGTLDASLIDGFVPETGDEIVVGFASGGIEGRFDSVASPLFGPPEAKRRFRPAYGPDDVRLVATCGADFTSSANAGDPGYGVPDFRVDGSDFFYYLDQFAAGNAEADITANGVIDADDFFAFLDLFAQGCE